MRIMVGYATRTGSTRGVAEEIGNVLRDSGADVDVRDLSDDPSPAGYDALVLGSGIRMRRWLREASVYLLHHRDELTMPVAYFAVCLAAVHGGQRAEAEAATYANYPQRRVPEIVPVASASFNGVLDEGQLSQSERLYVRAFGVKPGDYRDMPRIDEWAKAVADKIGVRELVPV